MTVATTGREAANLTNGVTRSFPVNFKVLLSTDLVVSLETISTGAILSLTEGVDYTVTGSLRDGTAAVVTTIAYPVGSRLRRRRVTARTQALNLVPNDGAPADAQEDAYDRAIVISQEQDDDVEDVDRRALTVPKGETAGVLAPLASRVGGAKKIIAIDQTTGVIQVEEVGPALQGNTGPANSTYKTIVDLRSLANPTNISAILTQSGLAGTFAWNPDETRADDGRDVIKSTLSATGAWARITDVNVIPITRFLLKSDGTDETAKIEAWGEAVRASGLAGLRTRGVADVPLYFDVADMNFGGTEQIELDFAGAEFHPTTQTGGRFEITGFDDLTISNVYATGYTQGYHIDPVFKVLGGNTLQTPNAYFQDCGAGIYVGSGIVWHGDVDGKNVGVMPRPAPLDPTGAGFGAAFERYGYVTRGVLLNGGKVTGSSEHDLPAGGASSDVTGGAGHYTSFLSNNFEYDVQSVNAPGQGACHAGSWQGHDILAELDSNTFDNTLPGRNNKITVKGGGANQELGTLFGVGNSLLYAAGSDNRACVAEIWDSWSCRAVVTSARESASAGHPIVIAGLGGVAGRGAVHCLNSFDCVVAADVSVARYNGVSFAGSRRCTLEYSPIRNYGVQNDVSPGSSSGVELGVGVYGKVADQITINVQGLKAINNTHGGTIFIQSNAQTVYYRGSENGGPVTIMGGGQSAKGASPDYYKQGLSGGGSAPDAPGWRILPTGGGTATTSTPIYTLTPILTPFDAADLVVSGTRTNDGSARFKDLISAAPGVGGVKVRDQWDLGAGVPTRAYAVDTATGQLRLTSGGDPLKVTVEGTQYVSAAL